MLTERLTDFPPPSRYPRMAEPLAGDAAASEQHQAAMRRWMTRIIESIQGVLAAREKRFDEVERRISALEKRV